MTREELKLELESLLGRYTAEAYPNEQLAAFVVNSFVIDAEGNLTQDTFGVGSQAVTPQQAYACVIESMQANVATWQRPRIMGKG
jgi:hypothetical protein